MTVIGFIRHGITDWNKEGRVQGSSDIPLNEEGVQAAEKLAARLAAEQWDCIFTSPMSRAVQTAEIIAQRAGIELRTDERIRERSSGLIEGTTEEERIERWGADWKTLEMQFETAGEVCERGVDFVREQLEVRPGKRILAVSHGSFIKRVIAAVLDDDRFAVTIHNTSLTVIDLHEKKCLVLNDTSHLQEENDGSSL